MKYTITHITSYDYESPVLHGRHLIRKRPRQLKTQSVLENSLTISPAVVWSQLQGDYFGNLVDHVELLEPHDNLVVTARSIVDVDARSVDPQFPALHVPWEMVATRISTDPACFDAREMQLDSPHIRRGGALREFAERTFEPGRPLFEAVMDFQELIYEEFTYDAEFSDISTPLAQVLREKRGVCQDFAHLAIGALRSIGLSARYVSGYLETRPPEGKTRLVGADASHAWASVYVPDHGWVPFDPTNNMLPSERHIVVAWGRDFSDVSPLCGVVHGGGRHSVKVAVDVDPGSAPDVETDTDAPPDSFELESDSTDLAAP